MDWEAFYNRFRTPDFVPGYEIQNRLGGGAFGEVYKARKHSIGKAYAIKFLKIDDDAQREAVERELEQVRHFAAIDHPNLVAIEDLGTVMGVPYLIMGYAGEDTLARALRARQLEPETALAYFVQACRGVLALHDRRLVHFDLKPSNVFLKGEIARVGDYGLSKMMTDGKLTLSFGRGTPQYMAPEMIKNRADHRADIYSLGIILYESIAGRLPFESAVPGTLPVREDDRPPAFPHEFPAPLCRIVERCLRLTPEDRYASVADLLEALGQTARPGDSIRLERVPAGAAAAPTAGRAAGSAPPTPIRAGEARQTAAELTRGAVEVARGVWDGLRSGRTRATQDTPTPSTPPLRVSADARVPSADTLRTGTGDPPPSTDTAATANADAAVAPAPVVPTFPSEPAASLVAAAVMHTLADGGPSTGPARASAANSALASWRSIGERLPRAAPVGGGRGGTIPVPPPAEGGWLGTLSASFQLATEVLVALLRGLGARVASGLRGRSAGRASSGLRWLVRFGSGFLRLALFCLALALLGALTAAGVFYLVRSGG